jgi:hypothetical protein
MCLQALFNVLALANINPAAITLDRVDRKTHLPTGRSAMFEGIESAERVI